MTSKPKTGNVRPDQIEVLLKVAPVWWDGISPDYSATNLEEMMSPALSAAERNMPRKGDPKSAEKMGGPFGAATYLPKKIRLSGKGETPWSQLDPQINFTFDEVTEWELFTLGANLVEVLGQAVFHAEIVACMLASEKLKQLKQPHSYNLWPAGLVLVTTSAPCGMCEKYLTWSRPRAVVAGTSLLDTIRESPFHEGISPPRLKKIEQELTAQPEEPWEKDLQDWGMEIRSGILRDEIIQRLLRAYAGTIYNSGTDRVAKSR